MTRDTKWVVIVLALIAALERGDSPEGRLPNGETALLLALAGGSPDAVRRLVAAGADRQIRGLNGTALDYAIKLGKSDVVPLLTE